MDGDRLCITVTIVDASTHDSLELEAIRLVLIPFLLDSPVKGKKNGLHNKGEFLFCYY